MNKALLLAAWVLFTASGNAAATGNAAPPDPAARDANLAEAVFRCTNRAELVACADALNLKPNDPGLLVAEADTLVRLRRPGEAIGVYRNASSLGYNRNILAVKIAAAESERRVLVTACRTEEGEAGIHACEAAWLPGAPDQPLLFKRRGQLLQAGNQPAAALAAYLTAARLKPVDRSVAAAIVSLTAGAGITDAATLAARAAALRTLGRPAHSRSVPVPMLAAAAPAGEFGPHRFSNVAPVTRSN